MSVAILLASVGIGVPALVVGSYPLHVWMARRRSRRTGQRLHERDASVSVIVPIKGDDEGRTEVLRRLLDQRTDGALEILFCVEDEADPAIPALRRISAERSGMVRLLITGTSGRRLGKLHNLIAGIEAARGDHLVFMDGDTLLPHGSYLAQFTAALRDPRIGLVTCFPAYLRAQSVPAAMLAGAINPDLLGYFAIESIWGGLRLANGPCMAIRRETLERIGGLRLQERSVLMDVILAQRVHASGKRVLMHHEPVEVPCRTVTWRVWWNQVHRWHVGMARVLSCLFYAWYCWMRTAFPAALGLALFASGPLAALGAAAVGTRLAVMVALSQGILGDRAQLRYLWLLPLIDVVTGLGAWYALLVNRVEWRGRMYRVRAGGVAERLA